MYGYVVPFKEELKNADFCLYRAFYCGTCKTLGREYGQLPRFTTNYDMTFLSVLLHDFTKQEVGFNNERCICGPRKKTVVQKNLLLDKIAALNVLLAYAKAEDDVIDGGGVKKRIVKKALYKHKQKAAQMLPQADSIIAEQYGKLRTLEQNGATGIDRVADCFAVMLKKTALSLIESDDENLGGLLYNIGKFVYIADAIDDLTEDFKKKRYNPLIAEFGGFTTRAEFIKNNEQSLTFILASTVNRATECFNKITFTGASDLLTNVVYRGLRTKSEELLKSLKKLPPPKI